VYHLLSISSRSAERTTSKKEKAASSNSDATNSLYVGNLSWKTSNEDLESAFSKFGTITKANIATDRDSGKSRGLRLFFEYV